MFLIPSVLLLFKEQKLKDFKKKLREKYSEKDTKISKNHPLWVIIFEAKTIQKLCRNSSLVNSGGDFLKISVVFSEYLNFIIIFFEVYNAPFYFFFRFKMEYEIVYSVAFAVPVLYFRIFDASNGEILWDLDQIGLKTR